MTCERNGRASGAVRCNKGLVTFSTIAIIVLPLQLPCVRLAL